METMKKILSLVLALCLVLASCAVAFADDPATTTAATNNLTADGSITVSGLDAGDVVNFYQVLKFDANAPTLGGWNNGDGFTLTETQIRTIVAVDADGKPVSDKTGYGISAALAAAIETMTAASTTTAKYTKTVAEDATSVSVGSADGLVAGLYVAIITPAKAGVVYNPVFVSADYKSNDTNAWAIVVNQLSYSDNAMAKKEDIPLNKAAQKEEGTWADSKPETVAVGDEVNFTVTTKIPNFADNYTKPVFKVTDVLGTGLTFKTGSLVIDPAIEAANYELTETADGKGFVLNFKDTYLKGLTASQDITITYKATVTSEAEFNVNEMDNTVTVNFSNNPSDVEGHGILKDKTKHYTFDIDSKLFGNPEYITSETVKVGVDANGKELTETVTLSNSGVVGALQGAEFKLYTDAACNTQYGTTTYTTDNLGHITIKGLDAGTYYLKETKAPDGYIKAQQAVKVEIIATVEEKTYTETIDGIDVTYKVNELKSYEVKIDNVRTATCTLTNAADGIQTLSYEDYVGKFGLIGAEGVEAAKAAAGKIINTEGVELPSTGGIGTTIFYILGGLLVVGAAVVLVARRKASN